MPNPFLPKTVEIKGQKDFDQDYISYEYYDVLKKIGDGENDYITVTQKKEVRQNISDLINSQASEVGVANLMRRVAAGLEVLDPVGVSDEIQDFTNAPKDLASAYEMQKSVSNKFAELPDELKNGRSFDDFIKSFNQKEFDEYITKLVQKTATKLNVVLC